MMCITGVIRRPRLGVREAGVADEDAVGGREQGGLRHPEVGVLAPEEGAAATGAAHRLGEGDGLEGVDRGELVGQNTPLELLALPAELLGGPLEAALHALA